MPPTPDHHDGLAGGGAQSNDSYQVSRKAGRYDMAAATATDCGGVPRAESPDGERDLMLIRRASPGDHLAIWSIIGPVIRAGDTFALNANMAEAEALDHWLGSENDTFVAEDDGRIVGTYYLRPNQAGGGRHVANCGYATHTAARGRGVARRMCEHSIGHARARGFRAMQFNFVVTTNVAAVRLWRSLGFDVVGRLPRAFDHPTCGEVDVLVMFRTV